MSLRTLCWCVIPLFCPRWVPVQAQQNRPLEAAEAAYDSLSYEVAIAAARTALAASPPLLEPMQARAWEIIAWSYAALGSDTSAIAAFREMVVLDPDRTYDPIELDPRKLALHGLALAQVLVVRNVKADSVAFVAGAGAVPIRFEVSRPARVEVRVHGQGLTLPVSAKEQVSGADIVQWSALTADSVPVPPGTYTVLIAASAFNDSYERAFELEVIRGTRDTTSHVAHLAGWETRPELARPPRNWAPLGLSSLAAAAVTGVAVALESEPPSGFVRREAIAIDALVILTGLYLSLRRPDPQPVEANIEFNRLLAEQIAAENTRIARDNAIRQREVVLTVVTRRETPP